MIIVALKCGKIENDINSNSQQNAYLERFNQIV